MRHIPSPTINSPHLEVAVLQAALARLQDAGNERPQVLLVLAHDVLQRERRRRRQVGAVQALQQQRDDGAERFRVLTDPLSVTACACARAHRMHDSGRQLVHRAQYSYISYTRIAWMSSYLTCPRTLHVLVHCEYTHCIANVLVKYECTHTLRF